MQGLVLSQQWKAGQYFPFRVWGRSQIKMDQTYWLLVKNGLSWFFFQLSTIWLQICLNSISTGFEHSTEFVNTGFLPFLEILLNVSDIVLVKYEVVCA
jgi:hypothetical protein